MVRLRLQLHERPRSDSGHDGQASQHFVRAQSPRRAQFGRVLSPFIEEASTSYKWSRLWGRLRATARLGDPRSASFGLDHRGALSFDGSWGFA